MAEPFVPADKTVKVDLLMSLLGQIIENVLWFHYNTTITDAIMDALLTKLWDWWGNYYSLHLSNELSAILFRATDMTSVTGNTREHVGSAITGQVGSISLPSGSPIVVSLKTNQRGRSYRGRAYVSGVPVNAMVASNNDVVLATFAANLLSDWGHLINVDLPSLTPAPKLVVCSHFHDNEPRVVAVMTDVVTMQMDGNIDSQRRRLVGRGR